MSLVLVQVTHHALAEQAGLGEAVPLLKQRLHNVGDKTWDTEQKAGRVSTRGLMLQPLAMSQWAEVHLLSGTGTCDDIMFLVYACVFCTHLSGWLG